MRKQRCSQGIRRKKKDVLNTKEDNCVKGIAYMPNQMKIEKKKPTEFYIEVMIGAW